MTTRAVIFVEGSRRYGRALQVAFREFFERAGLDCSNIDTIPGNSRGQTYKRFYREVTTSDTNTQCFLLVDSESEVNQDLQQQPPQPWTHLEACSMRRPKGVSDDSAHLIVQCMECWLVSDASILQKYFGSKFHATALPAVGGLEKRSPRELVGALNTAIKPTPTQRYHKGEHSYELLGMISPSKVIDASPWAKRLIETLRNWNSND